MKAIWRIGSTWFETKKEAVAFAAGAGLSEDVIIRVGISPYLNPRDLVNFLKVNFEDGVLK